MLSLTTRHEHFLKHLHTLRITNDGQECKVCGHSEDTAEHIRLGCQRFGALRRTPDESDARVGETISYLGHGIWLTQLISKGTQ